MRIVRERPSQRRYHRVTAPLRVVLSSGQELRATDWSLGGMRLDGVRSPLPSVGESVELSINLPFQGFDISFDIKGIVRRTDAERGTIGLEYIDVSERAHDLMNHFIEDLVRGQMASVEDTICRIDVPVTPISTKPDPNPVGETPTRRWPIKTMVMTGIYLVLGVSVFGYLGILAWSGVMRMEVTSAVVSAPLATVKMPVDGILTPINLTVGQSLVKGEQIARIEDPKLADELEKRHIELDDARDDLQRAEEKYRLQSKRMQLYQVVKHTDRRIAEARVASAKQALVAADADFERMTILRDKGLVKASRQEESAVTRSEAESRLSEVQHELERATALDAVSDRVFFNNKEFVADLDMMALEVDEAAQRLKTAMTHVEKLEKTIANLVIEAPFDGRIVSVEQPGNMTVLRNEPVLTLEKSESPTVTAFLTQDEVLAVGVNDTVRVFFPALGRHVEATVTQIDRNSAFLDTKASRYVWSEGSGKTAAVSLLLHLRSGESDGITAGLPAVVIFPKRVTDDLYHRIGASFRLGSGKGDSDA